MKSQKIILIAIAGGSASGKTTVAQKIAEKFNNKNVVLLEMDNYYQELSKLKAEERKKSNFDHPDAIDMPLLIMDLQQLLLGETINAPLYDFKINNRIKSTKQLESGDVIILDGIFALENTTIRSLANIKIFVDTDSDTRLLRRIKRDVTLRNRRLKTVLEQYVSTVKPMHDAFVEPTKRYADIIIPFHSHNSVAIDIIVTKIKSIIK